MCRRIRNFIKDRASRDAERNRLANAEYKPC
jgi:hypothetical protein